MNKHTPLPLTPRLRPWRLAWTAWLAGAAAALLVVTGGCGGGVGTGGTGSYASGPITGFGSIIVNEVHFDDSTAEVEDGDGGRSSRDELRLGMTVEIDAGDIASGSGSGGSSAQARRIRFESELLGLVGSVDEAGGSFSLLGQRVAVDATTVFDEALAGGLGGLTPGQALEVYAVYDPAGQRYRATRVAPATPARLAAAGLRLRGPVAEVDAAARTLRIGSTVYGYAGVGAVPADLAAGQFVRLTLAAAGGMPMHWTVQAFGTALRPLADVDGVKLKGLISSLGSAASFSVNGRAVDASGASIAGGPLAAGVRVEVEGRVMGGVLRASRVTVSSDEQERERGFELSGPIMAVHPAQRSFMLRGQLVSTAGAELRYENGSAADLAVGRRVEVRGQLSADRMRVEATRIRFE